MKRNGKLTVVLLLVVVGVSFFLLAPVHYYYVGPPSPNPTSPYDMRPVVIVSLSFYYLGFGVVSENLCGHNGYYFQWNWNVGFDC